MNNRNTLYTTPDMPQLSQRRIAYLTAFATLIESELDRTSREHDRIETEFNRQKELPVRDPTGPAKLKAMGQSMTQERVNAFKQFYEKHGPVRTAAQLKADVNVLPDCRLKKRFRQAVGDFEGLCEKRVLEWERGCW
jgi:hypothetical protein